jgi:hypothetical protein
VLLEPHASEGCWLTRTITECPPNPDRPITKPRFPPPGFLRSALQSQFEFSDRNGSPIERFLIPAN